MTKRQYHGMMQAFNTAPDAWTGLLTYSVAGAGTAVQWTGLNTQVFNSSNQLILFSDNGTDTASTNGGVLLNFSHFYECTDNGTLTVRTGGQNLSAYSPGQIRYMALYGSFSITGGASTT